VADHAGLFDHGGDLRHAADDMTPPEHAGQELGAVHAVLQRHHAGVRSDERSGRCCGRLGVVELDREDHEVDRADRGGVVVRLRRPDQDVAERAA
jgi:hypothetical protein